LILFRKRNDTPLPTPSFRKSKHEDINEEDQYSWEEEQKVIFLHLKILCQRFLLAY
jgi:hypothetical protein